ncbi:MAG: hypothetical protein ACYCU8_15270 [Ferrimicrobium acidiphilum]
MKLKVKQRADAVPGRRSLCNALSEFLYCQGSSIPRDGMVTLFDGGDGIIQFGMIRVLDGEFRPSDGMPGKESHEFFNHYRET